MVLGNKKAGRRSELDEYRERNGNAETRRHVKEYGVLEWTGWTEEYVWQRFSCIED